VTSAEPLCRAAAYGKLDVVRLLLRELGADVSHLDRGVTALYAAAQNGHEHVVRAFVQECRANIYQATTKGNTPLNIAAQEGHEHIVRCLLGECGADVNQVGDNGCSTLFAAAQRGHGHVVRCLVKEFGADVNIAACDGCKPLMAAADCKHGADSQASHSMGRTAADMSKAWGAPAEHTRSWRHGHTAQSPDAVVRGSRSRGLPCHFLL
jgi:ankyrin repeat protein